MSTPATVSKPLAYRNRLSVWNRAVRVFWAITWTVLYRPSPPVLLVAQGSTPLFWSNSRHRRAPLSSLQHLGAVEPDNGARQLSTE
jgi:hypothetical protein